MLREGAGRTLPADRSAGGKKPVPMEIDDQMSWAYNL